MWSYQGVDGKWTVPPNQVCAGKIVPKRRWRIAEGKPVVVRLPRTTCKSSKAFGICTERIGGNRSRMSCLLVLQACSRGSFYLISMVVLRASFPSGICLGRDLNPQPSLQGKLVECNEINHCSMSPSKGVSRKSWILTSQWCRANLLLPNSSVRGSFAIGLLLASR